MPLALEHLGQFSGMGGFARALQAAHHHDSRRLRGKLDARLLAAHQAGELLIHNLTTIWPGVRLSITSAPTARSVTVW